MGRSCKAFKVLAGCFGRGPEHAWLADLAAAEPGVSLTFVERRTALIGCAQTFRPSVVLLPLRDGGGIPSAPLIARLRENLPSVRVMVLLAPDTVHVGIAEAIKAGAEPAIIGESAELCAILARATFRVCS
jgi:ActR/RegA family two-component response regulator